MILFFDTETTGLPDNRMPLEHDCQPHVVQLAMLLTEDDGLERGCASFIVDPAVSIPTGAAVVHGITDEIARRAGLPSRSAVALWDRFAQRADLLVAHNIRFDAALIQTAWHRAGISRTIEAGHGERRRFCTMDAAAPIVNLPPTDRMRAAGFDKPKPPRLEECMQHFFGERLDGAHDALVDVRACARVFFHLRSLGAAP